MDIKQLKESILQDDSNIRLILEEMGCARITNNANEFRCAKNESDLNSTRICVKINENISSKIYDLTPIKGDIFTLIMELTNRTLSQSIEMCCGVLGIAYNTNSKYIEKTKLKKSAFGGFFSNIKKEHEVNIKHYDEDLLKQFLNKGNIMFKKDGIDYDIQTKFSIMFDEESNRVTVVWRDSFGRIIGIMGRYNLSAEECNKLGISKWLPLKNLSFPKSYFLYGLYENYKYILKEGRVYVGESEKFVLQCASFQIRNCVAIGSHDISPMQRRLLLSLGVDIVTCMDNDVPDEFNVEQCKRLQSKSSLLRRKIGFAMVDDILKDKQSPSDEGIELWNKCIAEDNIFYI